MKGLLVTESKGPFVEACRLVQEAGGTVEHVVTLESALEALGREKFDGVVVDETIQSAPGENDPSKTNAIKVAIAAHQKDSRTAIILTLETEHSFRKTDLPDNTQLIDIATDNLLEKIAEVLKGLNPSD